MQNTEAAIPYFYEKLFKDSSRDVQALRKAMVGELFIMFTLYFANLIRNHLVNPQSSPQSSFLKTFINYFY